MKSVHNLDTTLWIEIVPDDASTGSRQHQRLISGDDSALLQPPHLTDVASTGSNQHEFVITGDDSALQQPAHLTGDDSMRQLKRKRGNGTSEVESACMEDYEGNGGSPFAPVKRVKSIKVCSMILAEKSVFFQKLFTSPMSESVENKYTVRIREKEEHALEQLLEFIYKDEVTTTDPTLLIETLIVADKFSVLNAVVCFCSVLSSLPMSIELAKMYLELPSSSTIVDNALKGLRVASSQYLVKQFREIKKSEDVLLTMPLSAIRAIFSSSEIVVPSEEYVFLFLAKWSWKHYKNKLDRLKVFNIHLVPLIRFIQMSPPGLNKVLSCKFMDQKKTPLLIMNSLLYRSDIGNRDFRVEIEESMLEQRIYTVKPIRVINFVRPFHHCVVNVDLNKFDLENLLHTGELITETFSIATHQFHLKLRIIEEPTGSGVPRFGIFLAVENMGETLTINTRFSARRTADGEFCTLYGFSAQFTGSMALGVRDVFRVPWHQFLVEGSFLLHDFLHMRAEVKLVP